MYFVTDTHFLPLCTSVYIYKNMYVCMYRCVCVWNYGRFSFRRLFEHSDWNSKQRNFITTYLSTPRVRIAEYTSKITPGASVAVNCSIITTEILLETFIWKKRKDKKILTDVVERSVKNQNKKLNYCMPLTTRNIICGLTRIELLET